MMESRIKKHATRRSDNSKATFHWQMIQHIILGFPLLQVQLLSAAQFILQRNLYV